MAADDRAQAFDRRLHLSVGADSFLPTRLRVRASAISADEWIFGEPQMHELLRLLSQAVPPRLALLLQQRTPTRDTLALRGDTLAATLIFQPTTSSLWLLGNQEGEPTRTAVPLILLCEVEALR